MILHPAIQAVATRFVPIDECIKAGAIELPHAIDSFAWHSRDNVLGVSHLGAADPLGASDADGSIPFTVTTLVEDRDGDVVVPMGCQLGSYALNPVVFFGHQQNPVPIARSLSPDGRITVFPEENRIRAVAYFDRADADADFIYGKVKRGFLNAASIAFVPIEAYRRESVRRDVGHWEGDKAHLHHPPSIPPGWIFKVYDLTEWSIVGVPANAGAIRDTLDRERKDLSPRLVKALTPYASTAKPCWGGWCCVEQPVAHGESPSTSDVHKGCGCTECKAGHRCSCGADSTHEQSRLSTKGSVQADMEGGRGPPSNPKPGVRPVSASTKHKDEQPSEDISPDKACTILEDGEANGKPLTDAQRRMFGAACGRKKKAIGEGSGTAGGYTVGTGSDQRARTRRADEKISEKVTACARCSGSGNCEWCDGSGEEDDVECIGCGGSGECEACGGTGVDADLRMAKSVVRKMPETEVARPSSAMVREVYTVLGRAGITPRSAVVSGNAIRVRVDDRSFDDALAALDENFDDVSSSMGDLMVRVMKRSRPMSTRRKAMDEEVTDSDRGDASDEEADTEPVELDLEEEPEDEVTEPFRPKHSAQVMASLYSHAKSEGEYLNGELAKMDNPIAHEALTRYKAEMVDPRMDHLKGLTEEHHPDHDMDEMVKSLEGETGTEPGFAPETGEANPVERGDIPEEDAEEDEEEEPPVEELETPEEEGGEEEIPGASDADTEEILERYQHPKTGKWVTRKAGRLRRAKNGRVYLVPLRFTTVASTPRGGAKHKSSTKSNSRKSMTDTGNPAELAHGHHGAHEGQIVRGLHPRHHAVITKAANHMDALAAAPDLPPHHEAGLHHHAAELKAMCKELSDEGEVEGTGEGGTPLANEGNPAELKCGENMGVRRGMKGHRSTPVNGRSLSPAVAQEFDHLRRQFVALTGMK